MISTLLLNMAITNILYNILLVILLLLILSLVWYYITGNYISFSAGDSMNGEYVSVHYSDYHPDEEDIEIGKIIMFKDNCGTVIRHRIVSEVEEGYITKGDGNDIIDQNSSCIDPITIEDIVAVQKRNIISI